MNALKLSPVFISCFILGAHFLRFGLYPVAAICIGLPFLLFIRKMWVVRVIQIFLILGCAEWIRTLYNIAIERQEFGIPWMRMAVILGVVALFTGLSAFVFFFKSLKTRYGHKA